MTRQAALRHEAAWRRVEGAILAARFCRRKFGREGPRAEWWLSDEQVGEALEILDRLAPDVDAERRASFVGALLSATARLHAGGQLSVDTGSAIAKISELLKALHATTSAWESICADDQFHRSFVDALGAFPAVNGFAGMVKEADAADALKALKIGVSDVLDSLAWGDQMDYTLAHDLERLRVRLEALLWALRRRRTHVSPFVHEWVWDVAFAWWNATGAVPTYSGNEGARPEKPETPFQKLVAAIFPESVSCGAPKRKSGGAKRRPGGGVSSRVLRDTVDAFRLKATGKL
jgi:hypothetical protein